MKRFALLGAAGYIVPRHLQAIKETGNDLIAAMDINDTVGILDQYFPNAEFFTKFKSFEKFIENEIENGLNVDYLVICTPNYLHLKHIKFGLKRGINVICEKPLVIKKSDLCILKKLEINFGASVNSILQLRLHPSIIKLRNQVKSCTNNELCNVKLTYITSRGKWYMKSWKGDDKKSGGLVANIGVHFFDMLHFIFGSLVKVKLHYRDKKTTAGFLEYENATVSWFLSIDSRFLPKSANNNNLYTYRSLNIGGKEFEFSVGFNDLHIESYKKILNGNGFRIEENRTALETIDRIKNLLPVSDTKNIHPFLSNMRK